MYKSLYKNKGNAVTTVSTVQATAPKVFVASNAMKKMQILVETVADEVGWFMTVFKVEDSNDFHIKDVFLFEQHCHGTTTEVNEDLLSNFALELSQIPDFEDIWNNIKGWGHSHVNMMVTPSGQDNTQMEFFSRTGFEFFIRVIANKKGDMKIDVYNYTTAVAYQDVKFYIVPDASELVIEQQIAKLEEDYQTIKKQLDESLTQAQEVLYTSIDAELSVSIAEKVKKFQVAKTNVASYGGYDYLTGKNRSFFDYDDGLDADFDDRDDGFFRKDTKTDKKTSKKKELITVKEVHLALNNFELVAIAENGTYAESKAYTQAVYPELFEDYDEASFSTIYNEAIMAMKKEYGIHG